MEQITSRCYYLPYDTAADRPCLGYVRGDRFSMQIDGGNSPAHLLLMQKVLEQKRLPLPDMIAVTHSHWDHTYGLCAAKAPVIACDKTQEHLQTMTAWAWTISAMEERLRTRQDIPFCHENILKEYADPSAIRVRTADVVFREALTIDLGGVHVELFRQENSHADDCVIAYVPEEKVVFLGDICYEDLHHEPPCFHRARFDQLRQTLIRLDFDQAIPGHQLHLTRADLLADMDESLSEDVLILP